MIYSQDPRAKLQRLIAGTTQILKPFPKKTLAKPTIQTIISLQLYLQTCPGKHLLKVCPTS